ncbi:MAG TPA: hypothetical protein ENN20_11515 [Candidatus Marinimicrobia bacterium]|nr:hypothetical protein [Candidatus Neomarinimicrobiota bacterium]
MVYVYILHSEKDGGFYIGYTANLSRRVQQHNAGKTRSLRIAFISKQDHDKIINHMRISRNTISAQHV